MTVNSEAAFDALAADYDDQFTESAIGKLLRAAVWRRLDEVFEPGHVVLELNCGTGEDAVHLARRGVNVIATDVSPGMLRVAEEKIQQLGLNDLVRFERVDLQKPTDHELMAESFDGVVSNFGGLNCVADLRPVAGALARLVKPGGRVIACIMGPLVPWEWAWFSVRGRFGTAFRRLRPGVRTWRGLEIRYPTIGRARRAFRPHFRSNRVTGVGVLIPPPFAERWAVRHPRLLDVANRWERRIENVYPFPWLADHYVLELERVP